jgi:hypothetical protein
MERTHKGNAEKQTHPNPLASPRNSRSEFLQAELRSNSSRSQRSWLHPAAEPPADDLWCFVGVFSSCVCQ